MSTEESAFSIATELAKQVTTQKLFGGDLISISYVLDVSSELLQMNYTASLKHIGNGYSILHSMLETGSALLDHGQRDSWRDIPVHTRGRVVSNIIRGLLEVAKAINQDNTEYRRFSDKSENICMYYKIRFKKYEFFKVFIQKCVFA